MISLWDKETGQSLNSFWRTKDLILCVVSAWRLTLNLGGKPCFSWTFGPFLVTLACCLLVGWLVWFSFFLLLHLLLIHHCWKVIQLFRLQISLAFSFAVTNFLTFFPWFCPWKISFTFMSLLIQPLLVNDLILKILGLFVFIADSNPSVPPGAANPLQPSLSIHTKAWTHASDTRYLQLLYVYPSWQRCVHSVGQS